VLLSSGDSFPHLIQKPRSQLGFVTYLLNRPRNYAIDSLEAHLVREIIPFHFAVLDNESNMFQFFSYFLLLFIFGFYCTCNTVKVISQLHANETFIALYNYVTVFLYVFDSSCWLLF
jgi:hypothetical protein